MQLVESPSVESQLLESLRFLEQLFDQIGDIVFFVKDTSSRYLMVNRTLVRRLSCRDKSELLGRTTREVFPPPLGERYLRQDREVLLSRRPITARLELHLYPNRSEGWCVTDKVPILDGARLIGLAGVSRDLHRPATDAPELRDVAAAVTYLQDHLDQPVLIEQLAASSGLSAYQFRQRIRQVFGLTPAQLLATRRIDAASRLLRSSDLAIAEIAQRCGYADQSAFSRRFKALVGLSPGEYRRRHR